MERLLDIKVTDIDQVVTIKTPASGGVPRHMDDRPFFGLSFCTKGKIRYVHKGKEYISVPGVAVILPEGAEYELYNDEDGVFPLINFFCDGAFTDEFICIPIDAEHEAEYLRDYERMRKLSILKSNRLSLISILYGILSRLASEDSAGTEFLTPVLKFIGENYRDVELDNKRIADFAGISEVYLRRVFASKYRTTPKQYILELRIEKAKQRLRETDESVTNISADCGFSGVYHFCRAFKMRTGVTPTEYRSTYGNAGI